MTQVTACQSRMAPRGLVVPAYFHAAVHPAAWRLLAERAEQVRLVILNLASGPGHSPESTHVAAVHRLQAAGVAVAGYVDTDYGRRPLSATMADLGRYLDWYQVTGVCFDRVTMGAEDLRYYAAAAERARDMGAREVMFNHGTHPAEAYARYADVLGTFEGTWRAYQDLTVPRWTENVPRDKLYHVVYSTPPENFADAYRLAAHNRAGCVYVTERGGGNPYDGLPADWLADTADDDTQELSAL
jgi:hypothetical protein